MKYRKELAWIAGQARRFRRQIKHGPLTPERPWYRRAAFSLHVDWDGRCCTPGMARKPRFSYPRGYIVQRNGRDLRRRRAAARSPSNEAGDRDRRRADGGPSSW